MTIIRSTLFMIFFAAISVAMTVGCLPLLAMPRRVAIFAPKTWSAITLWGLKVIAGLDYTVVGDVPKGGVLVASKHMSMWDTLALYLIMPDAAVILKKSLLYVPLYGLYAMKLRMIAIDREGKASALRKMTEAARNALAKARPLIIFPEGTRRKPGAPPAYKPGVAGLYGQLDVPCIPVALNSGLFWAGPGGFLKKKGRITLQFLPAIPPGLKRREFMDTLQTRIETATAKLVEEGRKMLGAAAA